MILVDGIQEWGKKPSWSLDTEHPVIVALQSPEDNNTYSIERRVYNKHCGLVRTHQIGDVNVDFLQINPKVVQWKDDGYDHFREENK